MRELATKHYELNKNDIEVCEKIDEGSFGTVFRGSLWGQSVAVKCCPVRKQEDRNDFANEVRMLHRSQHPNVVTLFGFHMGPKDNILVMEYEINAYVCVCVGVFYTHHVQLVSLFSSYLLTGARMDGTWIINGLVTNTLSIN